MTSSISTCQAEPAALPNDYKPSEVAKLQAIGQALLTLIPSTTQSIQVKYSGAGDEGEIDDLTILPLKTINDGPEKIWEYRWQGPNGVTLGESYQPTSEVNHFEFPEYLSVNFEGDEESTEYDAEELEEAIKDLAFELIYECHPRWPISDGKSEYASGTLILAFPSLKVSLVHNAICIETKYSETKWGACI
jgi:hypothetical protein